MRAADIAYLASLVEKAPSNYQRRGLLLEELQRIYREAQSHRYGGLYRVPVLPSIGVLEVEPG